MKFENIKGSIVAMVTPFHEDGSVNFEVLTQLIERQIAAGTDGILVLEACKRNNLQYYYGSEKMAYTSCILV